MAVTAAPRPHPLAPLSEAEHIKARDAVTKLHGASESIFFRAIHVQEPKKAELQPFLEAEHTGTLTEETKRPPREAIVEHDVIRADRSEYINAIVNLDTGEVKTVAAPVPHQPYVTPGEFDHFNDACVNSDLFKKAMSEFTLPEGFEVCVEPWPYGPPNADEENIPRQMQGLVYAKDTRNKNPDSNHYGYPIPIIPVMDWHTKKLVRVERIATGGIGDKLEAKVQSEEPVKLFENHKGCEYVPELLDYPLRTDLKPINITQPEGASFTIHDDGLIEWQKWRFRLGFTPREGAVLHDLHYDNRSVMYRLSFSEMTVPYADPRPPFHRKQAFDFGDGGMGRAANNLELGCDCLGAIHYIDVVNTEPDGSPSPGKAVVCLHEQDNGILWKHTNYRTGRAVVTRNREFVVQFICTLANYEYVLCYKLDLAGAITFETRATGIVSVTGIDEGKVSAYGNVMTPGVLAQNHQHVFAVRIDPAIDSYDGTDSQVIVEESHGQKIDPKTNPYGNFYKIQREKVEKATWVDAEPRLNRLIKLENANKKNPISGKNLGYKVMAPVTQMLLCDPEGLAAQRAQFAQHNAWVTGYRDGELWAAGEFTNQSTKEIGGVADMVKRGDWFSDREANGATNGDAADKGKRSSPVVWSVFGLTHNPRVEDWPVMPVETFQIHIKPTDFFTANPAMDVPSTRNDASVLLGGSCCTTSSDKNKSGVQNNPLTHQQGSAATIDAKAAGANVDEKLSKRLSKTFNGLFGSKKEEVN
ncbi:copper amine oxidase [Trichoderma harzianum]|uniref:Amine oxidase n=1 Tax=Trichoderma harzianum TaxID=5544 RepID=A0A0F9XF93_TRIHA|nr:copper amine oxidase [Trichoderma harzianum]